MSNSNDAEDLNTRLERKKAFFDGLYTLHDNSDESQAQDATTIPGRELQQLGDRQTAAERLLTSDTRKNVSSILPRSIADTSIVNHSPKGGIASRPQSAHSADPKTITNLKDVGSIKRQTFNAATPTSIALPKALGKRKRDSAIKLVPEAQQIFKGLNFYFFPNSDTHPARKMRITKALQFGAIWQREWVNEVTHVILDRTMPYGTLLQFLKRERLDNVAVVNETWPAECIAYRAVLDTDAEHFLPIGLQSHLQKTVLTRKLATQRTNSNDTTSASAMDDARPSPHSNGDAEHQMRSIATTDELDAAIQEARALQQLPLEEDEETSRPNTSDGVPRDVSGVEETGPEPEFRQLPHQDKFQCMQAHGIDKVNNPNAATISILEQMAEYYAKIGDAWRPRAYQRAIATLRKQPLRITTKTDAVALPFIGERLAIKIEEIAFTDRLRRLDNARAEPRDQVMQTFIGVYGVGYNQASRWVNQGFTTLDELLEKADLSENQRIGIEHYSDFNSRIARSEIAEHGDIVRSALHKIDRDLTLIVGGSYRRGAETSGDIDCIITHPKHSASTLLHILIHRLIPTLFRQGFLKASLASSTHSDGNEGSKWHGASCLPSSQIWRRMDLLLVPSEELGAALIYFTGNDIFNRSLRLLASHKGMRLNQRGLYKDVIRGKARVKITDGTLVEGRDERRIFEILGVPWREPNERVC
ncbi:hypothetical protein K431DRAFT_266012 [Polychaeton citri CBS 116435]|uniref:DNA polymerase lambda n=1 Tax=Polychaeton citri CBS 116435 TaxID=1314669 RepID=A0A9P4UQH2_9PEZI|nr:hypothetical protein K431DRAFT_266012 [Polychaeton citri CBS 116435]